MNLIILDPGFSDFNSHHWIVNRSFLELNASSDKPVQNTHVFAAQELDSFNLQPLFAKSISATLSTPCYTNDLKTLSVDKEEAYATLFADEIFSLYDSGKIKNSDHMLLHTGFSFHLLGIAKFLFTVGKAFTGRVVLCGMFPCGSLTKKQVECNDFKGFLRYQLALEALMHTAQFKDQRITLATSCSSYVASYESLWQAKVELHPAINYLAPKPVPPLEKIDKLKPKILLYIGSVKENKGLFYITQLITPLCTKFPQIDFIFHLNPQCPGYAVLGQQVDSQLKQAAHELENFTLHSTTLSVDAYEDLLSQVDAVVLAYDPELYACKTSGVFWDIMRYYHLTGLYSKGTWMETERQQFAQPSLVFEYGNHQSLLNTVDEFFHLWRKQGGISSKSELGKYPTQILRPFVDWLMNHLK